MQQSMRVVRALIAQAQARLERERVAQREAQRIRREAMQRIRRETRLLGFVKPRV